MEEKENIKSQSIEYKMERDKYKVDLDIASEENKNLSNIIEEQNMKFNEILKEKDEYYKNQINKLNQRLRAKMGENMELNSDDNFINDNITNQKLAKNGEGIYSELLKLKKENEELKNENEALRKENERLKSGQNDSNNNNNYDDFND